MHIINIAVMEKLSQTGLKIGSSQYFSNASDTWNIDKFSVSNSVGLNNISFRLVYAYWIREGLAFSLGIGVLATEVYNDIGWRTGVFNQSLAITSMTVGAKFYLPNPTVKSSFRPYLSFGIGPFIGSMSRNDVKYDVTNGVRAYASRW